MRKSKCVAIGSSIVAALFMAAACYAQTDTHGLGATAKQVGYTQTNGNLYGMVGTIVTAFLGLLSFIFFSFMVYAGLRWMTARGNEEFVTRAKDTMRNSILGLTIIIAAYALSRFLLSRVGG